MSTLIKGTALRSLNLGTKVERALSLLPQTAQTPIFTITGGRVVVTSLVGTVTTAIQAQATTAQLIATPTVGLPVNLTSAVGDLTGKEIGALVSLPVTFGGALLVNSAGAAELGLSLIVPVGTIDLKTVASSTGAIRWTLTYVPFDDGSSVAAA